MLGLSENVGLIFPMIASHFSKRDNDQQNHWVQWATQHFQTHPGVSWCFFGAYELGFKHISVCMGTDELGLSHVYLYSPMLAC